MPRYRPVDPKADLPAMEREVLEFWRRERIFERSVERRSGAPEWVFYDGPPTANNRPHIGHVEARTFKDLYPRYRTMTGFAVHRKAGWDCHGLPVEVEVEKTLGTRSKRDIEAIGVAEFVRLCRESVQRYVEDWRRVTDRMGFWIDMDNAYWTMDPSYVQSVWWGLKRLHQMGLLYRDFRVTAYCPRCGTALSDHEVAMGYTTVEDPSVYVKFPIVEAPDPDLVGASLVGWTTTPWTLISNLGLAVAAEERYELRSREGDRVVVAGARAEEVLGEGWALERAFPGSHLVAPGPVRYRPPYENADDDTHRVVAAGFVSMVEGTGIVHMAPAFGAEDLEVARAEGWPLNNPVDGEGRFTDLAPTFVRGQFVKDADPGIVEDLGRRGLLVSAGTLHHTYPLCWRCETPLLYYARPAWYVRTTARKDQLLEANDGVSWFPAHIKDGRYGDWLHNNVDWSLSRERFWGTPLPVWQCGEEHVTVVGSLAELSELAGRDVTGVDAHRPAIDEVVVACPECGAEARRVPEVIDAWFDSGAMPYAQWGYMGPGSDGEENFRRRFPADFIAEGIDQTRGWFYSLMVEGVVLFGQNAYRTVICHGLVLDAEGRKMSKRLGNVIEPEDAFDRFGADAVRWFMVASGSPWAGRRASFEVIGDVVRRVLLTLWNTFSFAVLYGNIDQPDLAGAPPPPDRPSLDRWILSRLHGTVAGVREALDGYDATGAARRIGAFIDDLSNWYVRRSRRRFWDPARGTAADAGSKLAAHATLHECLVTLARIMAPFTPFVAEEIYRTLVAEIDPDAPASVHLTDFPAPDPGLVDPALDDAMDVARAIVSLGRTVRTDARVRIRQPLGRAVVGLPGDAASLEPVLPVIAEELNVRDVHVAESREQVTEWRARPSFRALGPRLGPAVQEVAAALAGDDGALARRLAEGGNVTLGLSSGQVTLRPEDVDLVQQTRTGWGVASDGPLTVALDLELDDELRREGAVRELIHHVQTLRKSSGLEVTDRIDLDIAGDPDLIAAIEAHRERLATETLAVDVRAEAVARPEGAHAVEIDGMRASLSLRRA